MDTHRKIQDQRERSLSLLIKAVCKSSHSHGFPMCPKSQAGKARARSWCPPRQGAHYKKRTLNLEIHHFYSKQKQVGSLGKDLISTLKFAHLETESRPDVWVRKRQTFLARTYRTFRTIGNEWCLPLLLPQMTPDVWDSRLCPTDDLYAPVSCPWSCSTCSTALKHFPPRKASFCTDLYRDPFPQWSLPIHPARRCFSCILMWA